VRIRADNLEIWWLGLYIDGQCIRAESGSDIIEVATEAIRGMVIQDRGGIRVDEPS
jgi:hypothetical protein